MGKGIYTHYKERLVEIGGNSRCLYLKSIVRKSAYDLGRIFEGRDDKVLEFLEFLHSGGKQPLTVIGSAERDAILRNLEIAKNKKSDVFFSLSTEEKAVKKADKAKRDAENKILESEILKLKELKREIEEIEKETGRYELYVGYPFVFGCIPQGSAKTLIKAPLMLFPVKIDVIDERNVEISFNHAEKIHINHALIFAYAQSKRLNIEELELEFDNISNFDAVKDVIEYLAKARIEIECTGSKNVYSYSKFKEPEPRPELSVRYAAVLGRFPLSNSIYHDYAMLEKQKLTNDAVNELLRMKKIKQKRKKPKKAKRTANRSYIVKMLDFAQSEVVRKVSEHGNMVIYGPPGTGKSQTIVNIITDAMCKHKRVLVVSQKKAALDVVYNRLGTLNKRAMYINDETKEKHSFYERCLEAHHNDLSEKAEDVNKLESEYESLEKKIADETEKLVRITDTLTTQRPFGLSLSEMYSSSGNLTKNSTEYATYLKLLENEELLSLSYQELRDALFEIRSMNLSETYYSFMQDKEKNPLIDNMLPSLDIRTLSEVKGELLEIQKSKKGLFNTTKYPYCRLILAYYHQLKDEKKVDSIVRLQRKVEFPKKKLFIGRCEKHIKEQLLDTLDAVEAFVMEYNCLYRVMTPDGFLSVIDNILRGNTSYIKLVYDALDNYMALRDIDKLLLSLDSNKLAILNFAYTNGKNRAQYRDIIDSFMNIRIYHEVLKYEGELADELAVTVDYPNITSKIYKLKEEQLDIAYGLCAGKSSKEYEALYNTDKENKDYLYQISKKQKLWPIRKTMEVYGRFILTLFPCWLLSPENVSNLLPLEKNLFDIVIFDEASQVFIESTIPAIYRGKSIVVAGDDKQLRPSTTFMKRYLGADPESQEDYSVQAALEVESLLDLAVARYGSANLTYHYRSKHQELIDFSNYAFYNTALQVAPNISRNRNERPIERYKVDGRWVDRRNVAEARKVVDILKDIYATRKNGESIGIITFNSDQQACIADTIDYEMSKDPTFRSDMLKETHRLDNGEDTGIFIKNLENVQGDERDIIIFSIGYAQNESGKVYTSFGSLSAEGGENRLNVAITRAKSKIIVVTSIEPEELKVENSKNLGPKLLQKYLMYVRAVAKNDAEEVSAILTGLNPTEARTESMYTGLASTEEQIREKLTKMGYSVDIGLGNRNNRISLAVFDPETDRYLVGVELDKDAFAASDSPLERDVYKPRFMESRGWTILRVWCRDWWLSPQRVIRNITQLAEKNKKAAK